MKSLNSFFIFRSSRPNLPSSYISHDCRLTVGSPSGMDAKWKQNPFMRFAVVLTLIFTIGVGNAWGASPEVINIADYAKTNSWSGNTQYRTITSGPVTITAHDNSGNDNGSNTGTYFAKGSTWRLYKTESSYLTISVKSGYELKSISFTFSADNNGAWTYKESSISSDSPITVSGTTISTGVVTGTSNNNNKYGVIKITKISVAYSSPCTPLGTIKGSILGSN